MDWARAKTILIVAFIITNIFLAYNVWETKHYGHRSERISSESIHEVVSILGQRGILISAPIPKDLYTNEILTVEYMEINTDELLESIYGRKGVNAIVQGDSSRHSENGIIVEVKNNREIFYNNLNLRNGTGGSLTEQQALEAAEDFLRKHNLYKETMVIDSITKTDGGYSLAYDQQYKDKLLEVSIVEMEITPGGVRSMHMLWLNPVKVESSRKKISHAVDALIKVASRKDVQERAPVEIDSIRLVHYYDWEAAREGEAFPAWRISVNGEEYYVNALSGQVSK